MKPAPQPPQPRYLRRSQIYKRLRSQKLAQGHYVVTHEPTNAEYYVFKRSDDWAIVSRQAPALRGGFRKKDEAMLELAEKGPKALIAA